MVGQACAWICAKVNSSMIYPYWGMVIKKSNRDLYPHCKDSQYGIDDHKPYTVLFFDHGTYCAVTSITRHAKSGFNMVH